MQQEATAAAHANCSVSQQRPAQTAWLPHLVVQQEGAGIQVLITLQASFQALDIVGVAVQDAHLHRGRCTGWRSCTLAACQAKPTSSRGVPGVAAVPCKDPCLLRPQAEAAVTQKAAADTTQVLPCWPGLIELVTTPPQLRCRNRCSSSARCYQALPQRQLHILGVLREGMHMAIAHQHSAPGPRLTSCCTSLAQCRKHYLPSNCGKPPKPLPHLQLHILDVLPKGNASGPVDDLHSDGGIALGLEDVIHQVFGSKVHVAPAVGVVLAQHTLRVQASQRPAARGSASSRQG